MKNLDKKQAVLYHRKPLGRQRTRQRYLPQCIIGFLLLLISIAIQAQIPQELIDKARAAGMTEEQIQREIAKHRTEQTGINQIIKPATEAANCNAERVTLVGSKIPISIMSPYCSVPAL